MTDLSLFQQLHNGDLSSSSHLLDLVNRMNLWPKLFRKLVEEEIQSVVPISDEFISSAISNSFS